MELRKLDSNLVKLLLIIEAGIIVTQTMNLDDATSMLFLLTFPLTVFLWIRSVRQKMVGQDLLVLLTAMVAVINVLLDLIVSNGRFSFDYIKKLVMFIMTLLFLQTAYRMHINQELIRFINRLADILTTFLIAMYFTANSEMHIINGYVTGYLTFRFSNPNTTGLFLTCLYMLEMYRLFARERWYVKLIHIIMAAFLAWFIVETQSRNCMLALAAFTAACFWLEFRSRRRLRITRFWSVIIAWFPVLFVVAYMLLVYTPWVQNLFSFLVDVGKGLDSRMRIWMGAVESITNSPLIGSYYAISEGTGTAQLHNSHLDIAASYGIPVLVSVAFLLTQYLHQKGRYYADKESFSYILSFACAILLGLGEAALFSGGLGIYIFVGLFLMLSNRDATA